MIPTLHVSGIDSSAPRCWPIGIGASRPRAVQVVQGIPWRAEFTWNDADQLIEVRHSITPGPVQGHEVYVWRGAELERIRYFDAELLEEYGEVPPRELVWSWRDGRPIALASIWAGDDRAATHEAWDWSADGKALDILESSAQGQVVKTTAKLEGGRVVHVEREHSLDNSRKVIDIEWSADGRVLSARARTGAPLERELVITFHWDERRRLLGQSRGDAPGVLVWRYEYDQP